ncbi:unnamed protein product, partial [marine sediment metagenome]
SNYSGTYTPGAVLRFGDPGGDGYMNKVEFYQDSKEVEVNGTVWGTDFSPNGEIPFVGDFDGDGYDDVISFERGRWAGVRVARSVPGESKFGTFYLWHSEFCLEGELPLVGDFNGRLT